MEITPLTIFVIIAIIAVIYVLKGFKIIPLLKTLQMSFLAENKRLTKFEFTTGNDLETSEVP